MVDFQEPDDLTAERRYVQKSGHWYKKIKWAITEQTTKHWFKGNGGSIYIRLNDGEVPPPWYNHVDGTSRHKTDAEKQELEDRRKERNKRRNTMRKNRRKEMTDEEKQTLKMQKEENKKNNKGEGKKNKLTRLDDLYKHAAVEFVTSSAYPDTDLITRLYIPHDKVSSHTIMARFNHHVTVEGLGMFHIHNDHDTNHTDVVHTTTTGTIETPGGRQYSVAVNVTHAPDNWTASTHHVNQHKYTRALITVKKGDRAKRT